MDAVSSGSPHTNFVNTPSENSDIEHTEQFFVGRFQEPVESEDGLSGFPLERRVITGRTVASTSPLPELRDKLINAVKENHGDTVKGILLRGLTPELCWSRENPLTLALHYGFHEIAIELLNAGWTTEDAKAINNLGWMYGKGVGVKQDYAAALDWFRKAADSGNAIAQTNLNWMYQQGHGHRDV